MGTVFEALYCPEGGFERRVAIKRIHPHLAQQPRFVDAFRREAELCARMAHPNVIQVFDFGRVREAYFLAMEYVEGLTLWELCERARTKERAIPAGLVGHIGREILAGLIHAHEEARGPDASPLRIVHRDLCPQNVLVSIDGQVKLTDFGVARALRDAAARDTKTEGGHLAYMAPEQARGEPIDPRSDLFPIGVILWELLAGRPLFRRENEAATLHALLSEPIPRVADAQEGLDASWDAFLKRALARAPADRFGSAREMLAALSEVRGAEIERAGEMLARLALGLADA
jgi:serine/threonine-protein kinase